MSQHNKPIPTTPTIREAQLPDLPSLSTLVPRSFFPSNPFIKRCFPDTPSVREYWTRVFREEILSPECRVLVACTSVPGEESVTAAGDETKAIAVLCLRLLNASSRGAGFWTLYPLSADTDPEIFQPVVDFMVGFREKEFFRPSSGKEDGRHLMIELFGVDHEFQGGGLGRLLLDEAGRFADEERVLTFVQANGGAAGVYAKMGFEERERGFMPGEMVYEECLMIRPCGRGA